MIDFETKESFVLINPKLKNVPEKIHSLKVITPGHFWLLTSGTTGALKGVALSKEALLASAKAVNEWIGSDSKDIWINPLPLFHVGGLGIEARSHLTGGKVVRLERWDPALFCELCKEKRGAFTSLVPTQLSDLVEREFRAPPALKGVFIGGAFLPQVLFEKARNLGWPLYITYGMTECASQVATSHLNKRDLAPLPHLLIKTVDGKIWVKGPSLLTTYAFFDREEIKLSDPKIEGWFETEDFGTLEEGKLQVMGRSSDYVKICGEGLYLAALEDVLQRVCQNGQMTLVALSDQRRGHKIVLVCEEGVVVKLDEVVLEYNRQVLPVAKIVEVIKIPSLPKTSLGKIKKEELKQQLEYVYSISKSS